jgi:hypothetical protein
MYQLPVTAAGCGAAASGAAKIGSEAGAGVGAIGRGGHSCSGIHHWGESTWNVAT